MNRRSLFGRLAAVAAAVAVAPMAKPAEASVGSGDLDVAGNPRLSEARFFYGNLGDGGATTLASFTPATKLVTFEDSGLHVTGDAILTDGDWEIVPGSLVVPVFGPNYQVDAVLVKRPSA